MKPAFDSPRQALAFALLLFATVLLPMVMGKSLLPPREEIYGSIPWSAGGFPYIREQAFEESGDIDIAFMGSSAVWWGVDAQEIQKQLSSKLGRSAVVHSMCWNWNGFDPFYYIARDLLAHRKVRMIVMHIHMEGTGNTAHAQAYNWFRYGDDAASIADLSLRSKASFYACSILGMPRNLVGLLRASLPVTRHAEVRVQRFSQIPTPMQQLGSLNMKLMWGREKPFVDHVPPSNVAAHGVQFHPGMEPARFRFYESPLYPMQQAFLVKFCKLMEEHGVKVVMLHMPPANDLRNPEIMEHQFWPTEFLPRVTWVGIPPAKLFADKTDVEARQLFYDTWHLNYNGQRYFTRIIAPTLIRLYENEIQR